MIYSVPKITPRLTGAFFIALFILIFACSDNASSISDNERDVFCKTYSELVLIQIKYKNRTKIYENAEKSTFDNNGLTKDEFLEFSDRISRNPELQKEIYEQIIENLKEYKKLPLDSLNRMIKQFSLNESEK